MEVNLESLKELIATGIVRALEQEFVYKKQNLGLKTANCYRDLKLDTIYSILEEMFTSDDYFIHNFRRSYWKGQILVDLNSKALVSITSTKNLKRLSKDKSRKVPHYMKTIINSLNSEFKPHKQLSFDSSNTDGDEIYNKEFNDIFSDIGISLKRFTYYIVAYDYKSNKVPDINWYLFGRDFYIEDEESLMKYIKPDVLELTSLENETDDANTNSEGHEPNEGIKLGLKKKKSKKHS